VRRLLAIVALATVSAALVVVVRAYEPPPPAPRVVLPTPTPKPKPKPKREKRPPAVKWRSSVALGSPTAGRLVRGVRLPARGRHFVTWDPVRKRTPNRWWRRYGTDDTVRIVLRITREFAAAHPNAPRVLIGDLSRPRGGDFGRRYGPLGHVSHQNGLDVDVYFPRRDRRLRAARRVDQVDRKLAQDLVGRFARAGAVRIFVGARLNLRGRGVMPWPNHDDHLHVRFAPTAGR
jgi:murein endopeptidase